MLHFVHQNLLVVTAKLSDERAMLHGRIDCWESLIKVLAANGWTIEHHVVDALPATNLLGDFGVGFGFVEPYRVRLVRRTLSLNSYFNRAVKVLTSDFRKSSACT